MPKHHPRRWTIIAAIAAATISSFSGAGAAWAFMSSACETMPNPFSIISCKATIIEEFQLPQTIAAGSEITKKVSVKNTGRSECFVRVNVGFADENCGDWASIDFNESDWKLGSDGYRYLDAVLEAGETSPPACTKVAISPEASAAQLQDFDVIAFCESTPSKGRDGTSYQSAQEAFAARKEQQ